MNGVSCVQYDCLIILDHKYIDYREYALCNIFFLQVYVCVKLSQAEKLGSAKFQNKEPLLYIQLKILTSSKCYHFLVVITALVKTGTSLLLFIFYTVILLRKEFTLATDDVLLQSRCTNLSGQRLFLKKKRDRMSSASAQHNNFCHS